MKKDTLVFLVADRNYLLPAVGVGVRALTHGNIAESADVKVFVYGVAVDELKDVGLGELHPSLRVVSVSEEDITLDGKLHFNKTHVSVAALARLFVHTHFSSDYKKIVYMDADIHVNGDLRALVDYDVADGKLLAAVDGAMLTVRPDSDLGQSYKTYRDGIGVGEPSDYFNSGVMAANMKTWVELSNTAFAYFVENSQKCKFHDQSALNAVSLGRRENLSLQYNWIPTYSKIGVSGKPRLVHFVGKRKSWHNPKSFGHDLFFSPLTDLMEAVPALSLLRPRDFNSGSADPDAKFSVPGLLAKLAQRRRVNRYLSSRAFAL